MTRMPNPSAIALVGPNGRMTTEWVRWFAEFEAENGAAPPPSGASVTLTGDVTGSGTGTVATQIAPTGVTPGTYTKSTVTIDADGRVSAAASGIDPPVQDADDYLGPLPQEIDLLPLKREIDELRLSPSNSEILSIIERLAARVAALEQGP